METKRIIYTASTREEFDEYFRKRFKVLEKRLKKHLRRKKDKDLLSEVYLNLITDDKFKTVKDLDAFINKYTYNHLKVYTQEIKKRNSIASFKNLKINSQASLSEANLQIYEDAFNTVAEDNAFDLRNYLLDMLPKIELKLNLVEQELYTLLYVKGLKVKEVCSIFGNSYPTIINMVKPLKIKIKDLIIEHIREDDNILDKETLINTLTK